MWREPRERLRTLVLAWPRRASLVKALVKSIHLCLRELSFSFRVLASSRVSLSSYTYLLRWFFCFFRYSF